MGRFVVLGPGPYLRKGWDMLEAENQPAAIEARYWRDRENPAKVKEWLLTKYAATPPYIDHATWQRWIGKLRAGVEGEVSLYEMLNEAETAHRMAKDPKFYKEMTKQCFDFQESFDKAHEVCSKAMDQALPVIGTVIGSLIGGPVGSVIGSALGDAGRRMTQGQEGFQVKITSQAVEQIVGTTRGSMEVVSVPWTSPPVVSPEIITPPPMINTPPVLPVPSEPSFRQTDGSICTSHEVLRATALENAAEINPIFNLLPLNPDLQIRPECTLSNIEARLDPAGNPLPEPILTPGQQTLLTIGQGLTQLGVEATIHRFGN